MKYLHIMQVGGLFHELYRPEDIDLFCINKLQIIDHCLDANNLFWGQMFNLKKLKELIDKYPLDSCPEYIAIKETPNTFLKQVEESIKKLCSKDNSEPVFFRYLETLSIVCRLYSDYNPHFPNITIQNGYEMEVSSAKKIYEYCLDSASNPYFTFIINDIMPHIYAYNPSVIFIDGQVSMYNMAICRLIKKKNPNIHICVTRHSSEYYSLNKLENHLQKNKYLFRMVDSVILEFFDDTESKMLNALKNNNSLDSVPNIIFRDSEGIIRTEIQMPVKDYMPEISISSVSRRILNVHIDKYMKCYWNKCYFCGINKKYLFENDCAQDQYFYRYLRSLLPYLKNIEFVWFIDEAITVSKLKIIARFLLEEEISLCWQARCRIVPELLDDETVNLLAISGLKELRLGLESASLAVLKAMNKFEDDFSLDLVEKICKKYQTNGISIHFPMIIGFPSETDADRRETFEFLQIMHQKYAVTFNINTFMLDISSFVFSHANQFDIEILDDETVFNDTLSNSARWIRKNENIEKKLNLLRDQYMRNILYPWMPMHTIVKPHIFYRLSETIRNTLIWKSQKENHISNLPLYDSEDKFIISDMVSIGYDQKRQIYIIYNWETHHYMIGNENCMLLLKEFNVPKTIQIAVDILADINSNIFEKTEVKKLINKMIDQRFIIKK